ncbi:hypothetical protein PFDG_05148, partial [Plasmodium falciparum Dd2]
RDILDITSHITDLLNSSKTNLSLSNKVEINIKYKKEMQYIDMKDVRVRNEYKFL